MTGNSNQKITIKRKISEIFLCASSFAKGVLGQVTKINGNSTKLS